MRTIFWEDNQVKMIDQRRLPHELVVNRYDDYREVAGAIKSMVIRGAPAIGALAAVDWGTALGVIFMAHEQGKHIHVLVDETRPRLQGAALTAWELMQRGVNMTLIADNAAGYFMQSGQVNLVLVGADRVAANGDVANKIGTYKLAVVAKENNVAFYPVVPTSTIDLTLKSGQDIPIEMRDPREVTHIG